MTITNAREPVFVPAISARARVIVREIIPGVAVRAVILTHGSPRTLAKIRTPALPMLRALARLFDSPFFRSHLLCHFRGCHEDRWYASGTLRRTYSTI